MQVLTGGTDNHLFLIDVSKSFGITGRQAESALRECGITLNRNSIPQDPNGAWYTSGLRLGTPATTTLGMGPDEFADVAEIIREVLSNTTPRTSKEKLSKAKYDLPGDVIESARERINALLSRFPLYPDIELEILSGTPQTRPR